MSITTIIYFFLRFIPLSFNLCFCNIKLSFCFVELVLKSLIFLDAKLKISSMTSFKVFLNFHSQDISINGQLNLLRQLLQFTLLHVKLSSLVRNPALKAELTFFVRLNFLAETFLISSNLSLYLIVVRAEIVV